MLSEEEEKAKLELNRYIYGKNLSKDEIVDYLGIIFALIEKQQKELNSLKEIEQLHKEENGKLRVELKQEKNKINTIKKLMAVGDITDEALFTLVQTTMAELERLEDIEEKLDKQKENNKKLMQEYHKRVQEKLDLMYVGGARSETEVKRDYIPKDKIKKLQGQLIMQLGSYVRDEASPEQERIAGGINIINKILKGE